MNDITVKNLTVSFDGKTVLDNFSYVFPAGHTTCIMGASGCGKTTLLNALLGFVKPDTGEISDMPKKKACVFQEDRLCEEFSAVSNVRLVAHKSFSKADAENLLSLLGIDDFKKKVHDFSGGMKRRVAIARAIDAIAADCDVILLDEAFKGLDADTRKNVIDVFRRYTEGKTIIAVTHDYEEAVLMNAGIVKF